MFERKGSLLATAVASTVLYLALMTTTHAGTTTAAAAAAADAQRHPCRDRAESHQFDFWIGDWNVSDPDGKPLGVNHVTRDLEGCVLRESWTGVHGGKGTSVNFYDPASKHWHQVWTDDSGVITHYVGELRDGAMRFHGEGFGDADGVSHHRTMDFIPRSDGSVRQLFKDSDDGKTWKTTLDGIYVSAAK